MRAVAAACGLQRGDAVPLLPVEARPAARPRSRTGASADLLARRPSPKASPARVEDRLGALLDHLFVGMTADEDLWRALLAEAIHGDDDVLAAAARDGRRRSKPRSRAGSRDLLSRRARAARPRGRARHPQRASSACWSSTCRNPKAGAPRSRARAAELAPVFSMSQASGTDRSELRADRTRHDSPGVRRRARRARPDAVRPRRRARRRSDWMRENDPVHWDDKNGIWVDLEVRGHLVRRASARAVLQRSGRAARRAAAPATSRSSRWTTPSTRGSAGSSAAASRRRASPS